MSYHVIHLKEGIYSGYEIRIPANNPVPYYIIRGSSGHMLRCEVRKVGLSGWSSSQLRIRGVVLSWVKELLCGEQSATSDERAEAVSFLLKPQA